MHGCGTYVMKEYTIIAKSIPVMEKPNPTLVIICRIVSSSAVSCVTNDIKRNKKIVIKSTELYLWRNWEDKIITPGILS